MNEFKPSTDEKLNEKEIQKKLDFIEANQHFEGFDLTPEDLKNARDVLTGVRDADDIIEEIVNEYISK